MAEKMYLNIGIDVSKNTHEACLVNDSGEPIGKFMKLRNSRKSIDRFRELIKSKSQDMNAKPRIGLEATGIYWYSLYSEISKDYDINIYNTSQIRGLASVNIRGSNLTLTDR